MKTLRVVLALVGLVVVAAGLANLSPRVAVAQSLPTINGSIAKYNAANGVPQATTGALNLFVDSSIGSDGNSCQSAGSPCLTVQAAVNKVPKVIRDPVEIQLAAGTYTGAWVEGFTFDRTRHTTDGGQSWLHFSGTMKTATVASGPQSAVATTGSGFGYASGVPNTVGVADAGWTSGNLVGLVLTFTGGHNPGTSYPISANTTDTVTFTDVTPGLDPAAGDAFTIQDWATIIDGDLPGWADALGVDNNGTGDVFTPHVFSFFVNGSGLGTQNVSFSKLKLTASSLSSVPLYIGSGSSVGTSLCKVTGTALTGVTVEGDGLYYSRDDVFEAKSGKSAITSTMDRTNSGGTGHYQVVTLNGSLVRGQTAGSKAGIGISLDLAVLTVNYSEFLDLATGVSLGGARANLGLVDYKNVGTAVSVNNSLQGITSPAGYSINVSTSYFDTVTTAVAAVGPGFMRVQNAAGTSVGTGLSCTLGALCRVASTTGFGTTSTTDIALDTANYSLTALRAASPTMEVDAKWGSRVAQ